VLFFEVPKAQLLACRWVGITVLIRGEVPDVGAATAVAKGEFSVQQVQVGHGPVQFGTTAASGHQRSSRSHPPNVS
jgi:hypothetical protein